MNESQTGEKLSGFQRQLAIYYSAFSEFTRQEVYI
ncbi:hypothetical protein ABIC12_000687 [Pantoea agglomerans]|jgi:hypothetical protein|nr:hypothetical protein [Pantoea brenneri]MDQ0433352.1 hypothetical protein [Pantoea agglomerans]